MFLPLQSDSDSITYSSSGSAMATVSSSSSSARISALFFFRKRCAMSLSPGTSSGKSARSARSRPSWPARLSATSLSETSPSLVRTDPIRSQLSCSRCNRNARSTSGDVSLPASTSNPHSGALSEAPTAASCAGPILTAATDFIGRRSTLRFFR